MSDEFLFADEPEEPAKPAVPAEAPPEPWSILIVDDDASIHAATRMVLRGVKFRDRPLKCLSASSAAEARKTLQAKPEIALVLLDVVMEENDTGLKLVQHIREVMQNHFVRIILRTGQPGQAPEDGFNQQGQHQIHQRGDQQGLVGAQRLGAHKVGCAQHIHDGYGGG